MSEKQIPISGKKIVTLGGSPETQVGEIDTNFKTIYNDLFRFRKLSRDGSLGAADQLFYALDQPGHYYFKVFFYFSNPYSDPSNPLSSNLLGTTYLKEEAKKGNDVEVNTALNYLYNNLEYTRFNRLAEFIQLLSDVSTKSPWYFQSISGLDQAIERQETGRDFKIEEERKQITVKCLADAYDNRIGRMLDLYRSVVWSQNLHKWILPANLRKFDMGIYIFNSPIKTIAGGRYGLSGKISERVLETTFKDYYGEESEDAGEMAEQMYKRPVDFTTTGSKYIELRGCEIDYNSSKTVYSELDNSEGKPMEYEITIKYDSAMEDRLDPVFKSYIGDFVMEDLFNGQLAELDTDNPYSGISDGDDLVEGSIGDPYGAERNRTFLESAAGMGLGYLNTLVGKVMLGNIYGFSFAKLDSILTTDPMDAIMRTGRELNNAKLIAKRISDFTDPDRGLRELSGKNLYDRPDYPGQPMFGGSPGNPLSGKSFSHPDSDHKDIDEDISGKNLYRGWRQSSHSNSESLSGENLYAT